MLYMQRLQAEQMIVFWEYKVISIFFYVYQAMIEMHNEFWKQGQHAIR